MYKLLIRPILFLFDPEKIHHFTFRVLKIWFSIPGMLAIEKWLHSVNSPHLEKEVMGLKFKNPVGLAAGFDKNAKLTNEWSGLGFGFVEVGTVTPRPQVGNPKPRMFRLRRDMAVINRMGFNNGGIEEMVARLKKLKKHKLVVGGNIGKNKDTPNEKAEEDYKICFEALFPYVDYFVVNVSSPNTPGLRELQEKEPLTRLLQMLQDLNRAKDSPKPILLKIAPDLTWEQVDDIIDIVKTTGLTGVVATNTTISREGLVTPKKEVDAIGNGGLSGLPLSGRAGTFVSYLRDKGGPDMVIISVGGIMTPSDAVTRLKEGADLVQVYTGFVYEGPFLPKRINRAIHSEGRRGML